MEAQPFQLAVSKVVTWKEQCTQPGHSLMLPFQSLSQHGVPGEGSTGVLMQQPIPVITLSIMGTDMTVLGSNSAVGLHRLPTLVLQRCEHQGTPRRLQASDAGEARRQLRPRQLAGCCRCVSPCTVTTQAPHCSLH